MRSDPLYDHHGQLGAGEPGPVDHLLCVSTNVNRPIGCNFPTPDGSRTVFLAPRHWTQERLRGWVGAHHEAIEAMFGAVVPLAVEDL